MGCDIHLHVEKYISSLDEWVLLLPNEHNCDYLRDPDLYISNRWYCNRNYELFSLLADVRSYEGSPTPISSPKGLPEDLSEEIRKESDEWGIDAHSHSYYLLNELTDARTRIRIGTGHTTCSINDISLLFNMMISNLERLSNSPNLDDIRIVFWFDN